jgi:hypothetical protein
VFFKEEEEGEGEKKEKKQEEHSTSLPLKQILVILALIIYKILRLALVTNTLLDKLILFRSLIGPLY